MSNKLEKRSTKRGKATYFYSIIGVAMVLFFLGAIGMLVINAKQLSEELKQRLEIQVMMKDSVSTEQSLSLAEDLKLDPRIKEVVFVDKDQAAEEFEQAIDEDFVGVLGYNPLNHSLNISVYPEYVQVDSLQMLADDISKQETVEMVNFDKSSVGNVSMWIRRMTIILGVMSLIMLLSIIVLIDNTVRLAMFSNRFTIKTMQMVGATRRFIARPFNITGIRNGLISGIIAVLAIYGLQTVLIKNYPEFNQLQNTQYSIVLYLLIILIGILITLMSTNRSVNKYLKTSLDDLY